MKKRLGARLREELERSGKSSKEIASSVHDHMVAKLGNSADKPDTVPGKLSKLLNDKPEGIAYFFAPDHAERLQALAHVFGVSVDTLEEWRAQDSVPTLVLDPRLPPEAIRFISAQADDRSAMYRVAVVERPAGSNNDDAVDSAIRAELGKHSESIAVVATAEAMRMFVFAEHSATTLRAVPRGYVLEAFPDLVPIPAPSPPRLFDDAGLPILPLLDSNAPRDRDEPFGRALDDIEQRIVRPAKSRGEVPCLSVMDAIAWNTRVAGPFVPRARAGGYHRERVAPVEFCSERSVRLAHLLANETAPTVVWIEGKRIYAVGPQVAAVSALFAPHHQVTEPEDLGALRARLVDCHPWQLLEDAARPEDPLNPLVDELKPWAEAQQLQRVALLGQEHPETARLVSGSEPSIRERLRELANYGAEAGGYALLFALARAADAPLVAFESRDGGSNRDLAVIADLGGGHLLRLCTMKMSGRRTPLVGRTVATHLLRGPALNLRSAGLYDGGDVLLGVDWLTETNLEGWSLPARRRRAEGDTYNSDDE